MDAVSIAGASPAAGSYARTVLAAAGIDGAAPVVGICLRAKVHIDAVAVHICIKRRVPDIAGRPAPSDARRSVAALAGHRGAGARQHIQLPLAAVFLNGRPSGGPRQLTVPVDKVQIRRRLSMQLDGRCLGVLLHLNVNVVQKNVRRRLLSVDLDLLCPDKVRIA